MQLEEYLRGDDRVVVPLGSTEQHAFLSVGTDSILVERASLEAAEPLGVPVLPAIPFGLTPTFTAFPGTINLRMETYLALLRDVLDSLRRQGFRRIVLANGHGGNQPAASLAREWMGDNPDTRVRFHSWLIDPKVWGLAATIDDPQHANWAENFPWTRLEGVEGPAGGKPVPDAELMATANADEVRQLLGDGTGGGTYQRSDDDVMRVWQAGVEELRRVLENGWPKGG